VREYEAQQLTVESMLTGECKYGAEHQAVQCHDVERAKTK
jgi:hypothetical protein